MSTDELGYGHGVPRFISGVVASFWPRFRFAEFGGDLVNVDTHRNVKLFGER